MKKYLFFSAAAIAALLAFTSCNKEITVDTPEESTTFELTVNAKAPIDTKAVIGDKVGSTYPVTWNSTGEVAKLVEIVHPAEGSDSQKNFNSTACTVEPGNASASFTFNLSATTTEGTYNYYAFSPQSAYSTINTTYKSVTLVIPTSQTPTLTSVDPAALLMMSSVKNQPSQATGSLDFTFSHLAAYGKITIKNVPTAIIAEGITSVNVSVPAGNSYFYWDSDNYTTAGTSSDQISINTTNLNTSTDFTAWFACIPNDITNADFVVSITTASDTYSRTIHIPDGKTLSFTAGHVSAFAVDMSTAVAASDLSGDYLIVSTDTTNPWYIMPNALTGDLFVGVSTSVAGSTAIDVADATTNFATYCRSDYVWRLAKYSGGYSLKNVYTGKYVTWTSGNTAALSDTEVALSVTDKGSGVYEVKEGTLARALQFNYNSGNTRFAFYTSDQKPLYFVAASAYKTVLPKPTITSASATGKTITVNWNEVTNATNYTVSCTGQDDQTIDSGTHTASFTVATNGKYTVSVVANGTGDYVASPATEAEVTVGSVIAFSWSRSGTTDTVTTGYSLVLTSAKSASGYYQDKSSTDGLDIRLKKSNDSAIFSTTPTTISVTAKIGGGSAKDPLTNSMMVCLVDNTGADIAGTATVVTTKVENTNGKEYTVTIPNVSSAYGVKFYHQKETSYNIRIFSASVSITE